MKYANRKDKNHKEITDMIAVMRDKYNMKINFYDVHDKKKFCDTVVGFGNDIKPKEDTGKNSVYKNGITILVEIKSGNNKLTKGEVEFLDKWYGNYVVVYDFEGILNALFYFSTSEKQRENLRIIETLYEEELND